MSVPPVRVTLLSLLYRRHDMCWQCDHPGATWDDYLAHLRELLAQHCWIVQGVQRERRRPPYAYTVGLAAHDRPELVVTGMPYDRAVDLLNRAAEAPAGPRRARPRGAAAVARRPGDRDRAGHRAGDAPGGRRRA